MPEFSEKEMELISRMCSWGYRAAQFGAQPVLLICRHPDGHFGFSGDTELTVQKIQDICLDVLNDIAKSDKATITHITSTISHNG